MLMSTFVLRKKILISAILGSNDVIMLKDVRESYDAKDCRRERRWTLTKSCKFFMNTGESWKWKSGIVNNCAYKFESITWEFNAKEKNLMFLAIITEVTENSGFSWWKRISQCCHRLACKFNRYLSITWNFLQRYNASACSHRG